MPAVLTALVRLSERVDPLGWLQEEHGSLAAHIALDERWCVLKRVVGSELQKPMQFLADFQATVNNAKDRVWVQTMMFTCGHAPGLIAHALRRAALRGVDTRIYVDNYTFLVQGALPAWMPALYKDDREYRSIIRNSTTAMYFDLEKAGVNLTYTNPPRNIERIFPYKNRNHVKAVIVDDNLYIGGLNFEDVLFDQADFMVKVNNQAVVSAVANQFGIVNGNRPRKDYVINCDKDNRLLVDRGTPGISVILDEAVHATRASTNQITLISMHPPSGPMLNAIVDKAKYGIHSTRR